MVEQVSIHLDSSHYLSSALFLFHMEVHTKDRTKASKLTAKVTWYKSVASQVFTPQEMQLALHLLSQCDSLSSYVRN